MSSYTARMRFQFYQLASENNYFAVSPHSSLHSAVSATVSLVFCTSSVAKEIDATSLYKHDVIA